MKRLPWADVIRVAATFFIVFIHTMPFIFPKIAFLLYLSIVRSGIGLFVMLSGALLLGKKESHLEFYKKRFLKIIIPWIIWSFVYIFFYIKIQNQNFTLHYFYQVFFGDFWFLQMIAGLYVITPILRNFVQRSFKKYLVPAIFVCFLFSTFFPTLNHLYAFPIERIGILPIEYLGYFLLGYFIIQTKLKIPNVFWIIVLLVGICSTLLFSWNADANGFFFEYLSPTMLLTTIAGFVLLYNLFKSSKNVHPKILEISKTSLGIFFVHPFVIYFLFHRQTIFDTWYLISFKVLIVFLLSYAIVKVIRFIPFSDKIVP